VHQGLSAADDAANQLNGIGRRFGEFDLVLGGHLHAVVPGVRLGKTDYGQAGSGATGVLRVDLIYDTVKNAVTDKKFAFLPVAPDVPEDETIAARVAPDLRRADEWLGRKVGRTKTDLVASVALPGLCSVQQLLCAAIAEKTQAQVVLHDLLSGHGLPPATSAWPTSGRYVPYENTVGVLWPPRRTPGRHGRSHRILGDGSATSAPGASATSCIPGAHGRRIRKLRALDGTAINAHRRIPVAFNSYHLAGGGGRFPAIAKPPPRRAAACRRSTNPCATWSSITSSAIVPCHRRRHQRRRGAPGTPRLAPTEIAAAPCGRHLGLSRPGIFRKVFHQIFRRRPPPNEEQEDGRCAAFADSIGATPSWRSG
jgi:2',3'-cyclic-nucleotide 2'-phosphodiesterase (5'-nucleotidase family)